MDCPTTFTAGMDITAARDIAACVLGRLIVGITNVILVLGLFFLIIGGIKYITSSGDPEKAASAKATVTWSLVSIALAASVWLIFKIILGDVFGIEALKNSFIELFYEPPPPITH